MAVMYLATVLWSTCLPCLLRASSQLDENVKTEWLLCHTNYREAAGLDALEWDEDLQEAAKQFAEITGL